MSRARDIIESVEILNDPNTRQPTGIRVSVNPRNSSAALSELRLSSSSKLRFLINLNNGDIFVWNAYDLIHKHMANELQRMGFDANYNKCALGEGYANNKATIFSDHSVKGKEKMVIEKTKKALGVEPLIDGWYSMSRAASYLESIDYTEWLCERMSVEERFMKYVKKNQGPLKCWKWTGGKDRDGYGKFCEDSKCAKAHQVSYRLFNGPISPGMEVMHSCDTPDCVCPEHLSLGDHATNMKDRASKGHYGKWRRVREMVSAMFSEEYTFDFEDSVYAFAQRREPR